MCVMLLLDPLLDAQSSIPDTMGVNDAHRRAYMTMRFISQKRPLHCELIVHFGIISGSEST